MGGEWTESKLRDVLEHIADNRGKNPKAYSEQGIPVIDNYLITNNWRINLGGVKRYIDDQTYLSFIRKHIQKDDVLITLVGNGYGQAALTPSEKCVIIQNTIGLRCNAKNDNKYLYYLLKGNRALLMNLNIGAAQPSIKVGNLLDLTFRFAPLPDQKAIAHILGSLDDKIELNRQMNATLEAMAQALFKSWFVDFDPVLDNALAASNPIPETLHARAETRKALGDKCKPLPAAIQQQFPSSFVFSEEMGWIPEGWEESNVGNEFDVTMGQSPPGDTYNENGEGMPFFQGKTDYGFRYPSNRIYCTAPKRMATKGDTLVSVRAPVGDVNMAAVNCCIGRGVSASRHKSGSRSYTYYAMLELRECFKVYEAEGTVFGSINQKDFKSLPQLRVPSDLIRDYEMFASSFDEKIERGTDSVNSLTNLRDTLLPKLLSGEIRIPDAEKLVTKAES
jgi:type I restriction enzyme S subunit